MQTHLEDFNRDASEISAASTELASITASLRDDIAELPPSMASLRKRINEKLYDMLALIEDRVQPAASRLEEHVEDLEDSSEALTKELVEAKNTAASLVGALEDMANDALEALRTAREEKHTKRQRSAPETPPMSTIDYINLYTTSCDPELELTAERLEALKAAHHTALVEGRN